LRPRLALWLVALFTTGPVALLLYVASALVIPPEPKTTLI
jgi:phage shock protein PspC (stress-responsive transcriptional regulator)